MTIDEINAEIKKLPDTNGISDGYHTFGELYDHRIALFRVLGDLIISAIESMEIPNDQDKVWKSKLHHDGTSYEGWFIAGLSAPAGKQISYHIPMKCWDEFKNFFERERAPEWDGHTPADVLERLKKL